MTYLDNNPVLGDFFDHLGADLDPDLERTIKNCILGLIVNARGSIIDIAVNIVASLSERQMSRVLPYSLSDTGGTAMSKFVLL